MARLLLFLLAAAAIVVFTIAVGRLLDAGRTSFQEGRLPDTVKTISYVLLIVLMFGVVTGWLGGL